MGGFAVWGILIHRNHLFPYRILHRVSRSFAPAMTPPRRFHRGRSGAGTSPEAIDGIARIPYLRGYRPATDKAGIRLYDRVDAEDGLNLLTSGHAPVALLMDMDGTIVKSWSVDVRKAFPGLVLEGADREREHYLVCARMAGDGGVIAMFDQIGLVRLDAASRPMWAYRQRVHHTVFCLPSGGFWVLSRQLRPAPDFGLDEEIWEDFLEELSPEGRLLRRISLLEALRHSPYAATLLQVPHLRDVLHTNSIQVFDGSLAALSPLFRRGNILISMRHMDLLAILDPDAGTIVWALTGQWRLQHSARLLPGGHLLLFDNFGGTGGTSRALEVDPFTQQITWSFAGRPGEGLFSETSGAVQRLSGGNTLVVESNFGRALEVTPDGRVVWEFVNPNRAGKNGELVATLCHMERVPRDAFLPKAAGAPSERPASPTP
jgi:Arylsulfotransferase (ASST)